MADGIQVPIVFSTDHNYVMQTGVCLLSLLEYAEGVKYDINIIVSDDVSESDKAILQSQVSEFNGHKLNFKLHNNEFEKSFQIRDISTSAYYRLLIPWLFPQYDKVIYSDVDVIFHTSLKDVYFHDISNNLYGAVPAVRLRTTKRGERHGRHNNMDMTDYYNSGFLIINCKQQRKENLQATFLALAGKRFTYQDQDIINKVAYKRIYPISTKYCVIPHFFMLYLKDKTNLHKYYGGDDIIKKYLRGESCIMHYAGPKPWNVFTFGHSLWWDTYRRSVFYNPTFEINKNLDIMDGRIPWIVIFKNIIKKIKGRK